MEGRAKALVLWLQQATDSPPINTITEVRNCRLLELLLSQVEGFYFNESAGSGEWKQNYSRLRSLYEQVETYLRDTLKLAPPSSLSAINLVEMAKGESEQGLQSLLLLVFIVCIRCPIRESSIKCVMKLSESEQAQLMGIIQDWQSNEVEQEEDDSQLNFYKQELARIEFLYQNLVQENNSLRASLEEDYERFTKNEDLVSRLQNQNEQLQLQLSERSEQLRLREQNFLDKYAQHNQDIVQDLKKKLLEQEQTYSTEILRLKDTIYSLQESLGQAKRQSSELLEMQERRSLIQSRDEHINCISIEKHKSKINEILAQSKESQKSLIDLRLEKIKLENRLAQMDYKLKKQAEQIRKKQTQFIVNSQDANKLKIQLFTRVRDCLRQKCMEYKTRDSLGSGGKIDFLDDE